MMNADADNCHRKNHFATITIIIAENQHLYRHYKNHGFSAQVVVQEKILGFMKCGRLKWCCVGNSLMARVRHFASAKHPPNF
jgi:hypothetical protein